ncbi:SELENOP [Branchiostoma lanceolatum]|uniref:SELENOP protein n=1 Tax=Branchiostoma lanceolatum TaxID=7740 RepID=A0A8K0EHS8_BRALA|nr:SELENOP [Branchiostoma lanceolatum]
MHLNSRFERLRSTLVEEGLDDISFGVVNSHLRNAPLEIGEIEGRVNFPVYQDTAQDDIWSLLDARKDDFIIYDRCGRLVRHVRMPQAHMDNPDVENIIRAAYYQSPCGPCATPPVPMDEADLLSGYPVRSL